MKPRATVIIPTFGNAKFARWAIKSVQNQTVRDIEICIICDGSPEHMISFFRKIAKRDPRIKVFTFPKSPRTGEPYRDIVIKQTAGEIICYCSHDDLWLPNHIHVIERSLTKCHFTHSLHTTVNLPGDIKDEYSIFQIIDFVDLTDPKVVRRMLDSRIYFGLTFGAHTRNSYMQLKEGWITTPHPDVATDVYMWRKYLTACGNKCKTTNKLTALHFPKTSRADWSEAQHDKELEVFFDKIKDQAFLKRVQSLSFLWNFELAQTKEELKWTKHELSSVYRSASWRYTSPLRSIKQFCRRLFIKGLAG